jgi:hypothetical protein
MKNTKCLFPLTRALLADLEDGTEFGWTDGIADALAAGVPLGWMDISDEREEMSEEQSS